MQRGLPATVHITCPDSQSAKSLRLEVDMAQKVVFTEIC